MTAGLDGEGRKELQALKAETCPDCDHPVEFHNAVGCAIPECGCMTEGEQDD